MSQSRQDRSPEQVLVSFEPTTKEIMERFPSPVPSNSVVRYDSVSYCVGGACVQWVGTPFPIITNSLAHKESPVVRFPDCVTIYRTLRKLNKFLPEDVADYLSGQIVEHNERNEMLEAWEIVNAAIAFPKPVCPLREVKEFKRLYKRDMYPYRSQGDI